MLFVLQLDYGNVNIEIFFPENSKFLLRKSGLRKKKGVLPINAVILKLLVGYAERTVLADTLLIIVAVYSNANVHVLFHNKIA